MDTATLPTTAAQAAKEDAKDPARPTGLDPITYGMGEGAKTGWLTFLVTGAVTGAAYYIGREKNVKWLKNGSDWLEAQMESVKKHFFSKTTKYFGEAIGVGVVFGQLASFLMHAPATTYGIIKARKENKRTTLLVEDNAQLAEDKVRLSRKVAVSEDEIKHLTKALEQVRRSQRVVSADVSGPGV